MGVGISYSGRGGKRNFNLSGLPTGEAADFLGAPRKHKQFLPENFKKALVPQPIDPTAAEKEGKVKLNAFDMRPDTLDKKTMPGSAVTTSASGLCLVGKEQNPAIVGTKLYGSHGGKKGYHSFDDFDPPVAAERVGSFGAGKEGADTSKANLGAPFAYQVSSRLVLETDDLGRQILVEYDKDVQVTSLGRHSLVTEERRRVVGILHSGENSKTPPGVFEPVFDEDGKLKGVDDGFYPYGRRFIFASDRRGEEFVKDSAKIDDGVIWMKIYHAIDYADPSMEIIGDKESDTVYDGSDKTYTTIPLYRILEGRIVLDCRSMLALAVRE